MKSPYSPAQFNLMINPALARVYIELYDALKDRMNIDELLWDDPRVTSTLCGLMDVPSERLTMLINYASSQAEQVEFILKARKLNAALWEADEIEQLDGQPALDFALGWMQGLKWIDGLTTCYLSDRRQCEKALCPPGDAVTAAANAFAERTFPISLNMFLAGFKKVVARQIGTPGACAIQPPSMNR